MNQLKQLEKQARKKSQEIYRGEHGDKKVSLWICGNLRLPEGRKTKCSECKDECYFDTNLKIQFEKKHKKICVKCAYKNHLNDMSALEREVIEERARYEGWDKKKKSGRSPTKRWRI